MPYFRTEMLLIQTDWISEPNYTRFNPPSGIHKSAFAVIQQITKHRYIPLICSKRRRSRLNTKIRTRIQRRTSQTRVQAACQWRRRVTAHTTHATSRQTLLCQIVKASPWQSANGGTGRWIHEIVREAREARVVH